MQLGILGLSKVGKTTLFNTATAAHQATDKFTASAKTHVGVAKVPDPRLEALRDLFSPRRFVPATVEYVDIPGLRQGEGRESLDPDWTLSEALTGGRGDTVMIGDKADGGVSVKPSQPAAPIAATVDRPITRTTAIMALNERRSIHVRSAITAYISGTSV